MGQPRAGRQNQERTSPILQGGCAVIMVSNMLIYIGVIIFVFRLLDHSRLDTRYIAARGFTHRDGSTDAPIRPPPPLQTPQSRDILAEISDATRAHASRAPNGPLRSATDRLITLQASQPEIPIASLTRGATSRSGLTPSAHSRSVMSIRFPNIPSIAISEIPSYPSTPVQTTPDRHPFLFWLLSAQASEQFFYAITPPPIGPTLHNAERLHTPGASIPSEDKEKPDVDMIDPGKSPPHANQSANG